MRTSFAAFLKWLVLVTATAPRLTASGWQTFSEYSAPALNMQIDSLQMIRGTNSLPTIRGCPLN